MTTKSTVRFNSGIKEAISQADASFGEAFARRKLNEAFAPGQGLVGFAQSVANTAPAKVKTVKNAIKK